MWGLIDPLNENLPDPNAKKKLRQDMMSRVDGEKGTMQIDIANPLLFEIAWEVANKGELN
jgi:hypothetical protein